jgi:hypothetical protein
MSPKNKKSPIALLSGFTSYIIAGSLLLTSCSKSFTSSQDALLGQPASTQFFKTADDAARAVNSIYGNLRSYNNVAIPALCIESMGSDDAIKGSVASDATYFNLYDNFTVDPSEAQLDNFWTGQYQNINFCNQVIGNVPNINMDASLKARYIAEAKFVRAWSYFRLVRAYGNLPLVLKTPSTAAEQNPKQTTPDQIYAAIEQDLTDAASVLPASYGPSDVGRATKGAALGLHAKVAMYLKKWSDVLNYTNQVMTSGVYQLYPDFYQEFRYAHENSPESVFEIQCDYVPGNDDISSSQYSQVQGDRDVSPSVGFGLNEPTNNLVAEFESGDPRLQGTVLMAGTTTPDGDAVPQPSQGAPDKYNMKAYVPFAIAALSGNQGCGQNIRVMRYSEVLLMNAEANNELGNTTDALSSLELVRARARNSSSDPATTLPAVTTTDQGALRTAIYHERRVELAMEYDRYFDLIRQGRAATVLAPNWKANNNVWPIPQIEIDNSGGTLVQNPGY